MLVYKQQGEEDNQTETSIEVPGTTDKNMKVVDLQLNDLVCSEYITARMETSLNQRRLI